MVFADNDRPGIMLASAARTYLNHYGVAVGRKVGVYTANDTRLCGGDRPEEGRRQHRGDRRPARQPGRAAARRGARARHRAQPRPRRGRQARGKLRRLVHGGAAEERRRRAHHPGRRAADVGRLDAVGAPLLAVARQGRLRRRDAGASCRASMRRTASRSARATAPTASRRRVDEALRGGRPTAARMPAARPPRPIASRRPMPARAGPAAWLGAAPGRGCRTRRSRPSSTSRTTSPPRTSAWRCARACARSSTSSASPPTAWRPTRARPRTCTAWRSRPKTLGKEIPEVGLTTFRAPYTPVTFGAIVNHARGPLFDPTRKTRDPSLGGGAWRGVRGCRPVEARLVFPARRRGHACGGQPRMRDGAQGRRPVRRLDARQDRGGRAGRGRSSWNCSTPTRWEKLEPGRCRYGIMLREDGFIYDDGVVGRLADGSLPRHHHDRRRAARHEP